MQVIVAVEPFKGGEVENGEIEAEGPFDPPLSLNYIF